MKSLLPLALVLLLVASCSKYEEGPWFSLKSKQERIANTWFVAIALSPDEEDITANFNRQIFTFTKDGQVSILFAARSIQDSIQGNWFFSDKKKTFNWELSADASRLMELEFHYPAQQAFEILRMDEKELWLKDENGGRLFLVEK